MTRTFLALGAALFIVAAAIRHNAFAAMPDGRGDWRPVVTYIQHALKIAAPPVPGSSLAVRTSSGEIYSASFGFADLSQKLPVTSKTRFSGGSLAKQFTAFAVYDLSLQQR